MIPTILSTFLLVFGVLAFLEFFDRTNFALIALSSKQPAVPTWAGAILGFTTVAGIAVIIGAALLSALGGQVSYLRIGGGVFLLGYAVYLAVEEEKEVKPSVGLSAVLTAFVMIFLLELGDTTMIFTLLFATATGNPLLVWVAASLALAFVSGTGCFFGSRIGARLDPRRLKIVVVASLTIVAILTILYGIFPNAFPSL